MQDAGRTLAKGGLVPPADIVSSYRRPRTYRPTSMQPNPARPPWQAVAAVALVSFTILAAEVALTRVFSVLFRAPYVFLIISGAIGGLGLGGLLVQFLRPREERLQGWIAGLAVLLAAALAAPVLILFASPWGHAMVAGAETAVVVGLPMLTFLVAGMLLALIFRRYAPSGGFLYFVDLAAAALAAPTAVLLLDSLGGLNTPLALAVLAAAAGALLALRSGGRGWGIAAVVAFLALGGIFGSNLAGRWIDLPQMTMPSEARRDPSHPWNVITKPLFKELADPFSSARIVRTDWSAVSRTDVVFDPSQEIYYVYTDGDVPTQMEPWNGDLDRARRAYAPFIGTLPYRLREGAPERVMAIGSGGGLDALLALAHGARSIDAVEINPSIPRIVADPRFAETYARVYKAPNVRLVVDEGRSFLQRSGRYDVIYFACAKTATTQTSGVALLDNHLYTVEAFRDYWRHLSDDGVAALVVQEPFLVDRLLLTALTTLREVGVPADQAGAHVLTARVSQHNPFGLGPYRQILLLRRKPWAPGEMTGVRNTVMSIGLEPLYLPFVKPEGGDGKRFNPAAPLPEIRHALESQYPIPADLNNVRSGRTVPANLSAVTDDSPFYVDVARGLHPTLAGLLWGAAGATVLVLLLVGGAAVRASREPVLAEGEGRAPDHAVLPVAGAGILYFSMLGAGFMLVELALMQRFILLLGFPTRSLTVTLASLLIACALGSGFSQRGTPAEAAARLRRLLPLLVGLLLLYLWALPAVLHALLPLPLPARILATALLLFPPGFLMGMPFPTALRNLEGAAGGLIPGFWSVNGVTSILGSVAAMAVAKFAGYSGALVLGAVLYAVAWAVIPLLMGKRAEMPRTGGELTSPG